MCHQITQEEKPHQNDLTQKRHQIGRRYYGSTDDWLPRAVIGLGSVVVRVVLGAVAPIPWRSPDAEQALVGKPLNEATAAAAPPLEPPAE